MKPTLLTIATSLFSLAGLSLAQDPEADSIFLGKFFPKNIHRPTFYVAWPAESSPCNVPPAFIAPTAQGLCGHPFTAGSNPNFTNVEAEDCQDGPPVIEPVKAGTSPVQLCIQTSPFNITCNSGNYEGDYLCGGPLTE